MISVKGGIVMKHDYGTSHLTRQQQAIINQRKRNDKILREESNKKKEAQKEETKIEEVKEGVE